MSDPLAVPPIEAPPYETDGFTRRRLLERGAVMAAGASAGAALLAACGGGSSSSSSSAAPATSAASSGATGAGSTAAAASSGPIAKPVTITFWTWAWPEDPEGANYMKAFRAAEPNVKVEIKKFPFADYLTALKTALPNGTAGDIVNLTSGSLLRQYASFLAPLDDYASKAWGADWESGFIPAAMKELDGSVPAGTPRVALPQQYSLGNILFYSKVLLQKAGVELPQSQAEWTAAYPALQKAGLVPAIWGAKDQWMNTDYLIGFSSQFKPGVVEAAENGKASFADPAIVSGLEFMRDSLGQNVWNKSPFATLAFPDAFGLWQSGKALAAPGGSWAYALMPPAKMDDYGAFLWPHLPNAPATDTFQGVASGDPKPSGMNPSRPWRTINVTTSMRKGVSGDKAEAAWRWIQFWCGEAGQKAGAKQWTPARPNIEIPGLTDQWLEISKWVDSLSAVSERREFVFPDTRTALQDAIQNVCVNKSNPASELAKVDAAAKKARGA
jgi:ABC-type glycerol-3-phosphate transport system substrate-binding protein